MPYVGNEIFLEENGEPMIFACERVTHSRYCEPWMTKEQALAVVEASKRAKNSTQSGARTIGIYDEARDAFVFSTGEHGLDDQPAYDTAISDDGEFLFDRKWNERDYRGTDGLYLIGGGNWVVWYVETDVAAAFPNGECPDCFRRVPTLAKWGDACSGCSHVFNKPAEDDT